MSRTAPSTANVARQPQTEVSGVAGRLDLGDQHTLRGMFNPAINYERRHATDALSLVSDEQLSGKLLLDIGCGNAPSRRRLEAAGARWIGIDVLGNALRVRGDIHHLPFPDRTFDFVLSDAVFEHLYNPFEAVTEIARVLKDGGCCFGYVAFLEPFHISYFHHSHRGLEVLLESRGFRVTDVLSGRSGIEKQLQDMLFPARVPVLTTVVLGTFHALIVAAKQMVIVTLLLGLWAKRRPAKERREKIRLYRTFLDVGFSAGLLFRAVKDSPNGKRPVTPDSSDDPPRGPNEDMRTSCLRRWKVSVAARSAGLGRVHRHHEYPREPGGRWRRSPDVHTGRCCRTAELPPGDRGPAQPRPRVS